MVRSVLFSSSQHLAVCSFIGLPQQLSGKESTCGAGNTGDQSSVPQFGRSPEGRCGDLLQYSCLENPIDERAWQAI